jgi:hypothetical protein
MIDSNLLLICILTAIIHIIGTLAYAARIAGIRTGHLATSLTLFNLLILVSRTSNTFQAPFIAKRIELSLSNPNGLFVDFQWIIGSAVFATIVGGFLVPTAQRIFARGVYRLQVHRSMLRLLLDALQLRGFKAMVKSYSLPRWQNVYCLKSRGGLSIGLLLLNVVAVSLWTVGVFSALYAGALEPDLRATCGQLSSIINGGATIIMFLLLDPQLSLLTDDVVRSKKDPSDFRAAVGCLVVARLMGVILAHFLLLPCANAVAWAAKLI